MSTRQYQPGDTYSIVFAVKDSTGALTTLTGGAGLLMRGTGTGAPAADLAVPVTIAPAINAPTGFYSATGTFPNTYVFGDRLSVLVTGSIGGTNTGEKVDELRLVGWPNNALPNAGAAAAGGLPIVGSGAGGINVDGSGNVPINLAAALPGTPAGGSVGEALKRADVSLPGLGAGTSGGLLLFGTGTGSINPAGGKVPAIVAGGDDADAAAVRATIGVAGAGLTGLGDARLAHLDADVSSRLATSVYTAPADPWAVTLPGSYGAGTAGKILGSNLDVAVSTRSTFNGTAVASVTGSVGSVVGNVGGNVAGSVASVTAGVVVTTNNDKAGYALSAAGLDAVPVEAALNFRQSQSLIAAVLLGVETPGTNSRGTTVAYAAAGDSLTGRVTGTIDPDNVRIAVTLVPPA